MTADDNMAISPDSACYRFLVLFFNCMLTFGSYFCFDMPSVLQDVFQGPIECVRNATANHTDGSWYNLTKSCEEGLGMSSEEYNLLYAIYAWTNALVVIAAGFLIDKLGNRIGVFLFSGLCVVGSSIFAIGTMFKGTKYMLPLMLVGRLLFGSGNGSLTIVQNRITAFWFKGKELALAFGLTLTVSRLGSVLNFFVTESFEEKFGLDWTLWGGAVLCGLGFVSAAIVSALDVVGVRNLGQTENMAVQSKKMRFTDIKYFTGSFWLLVLTIMFFYNGVFPFVADASNFIQDKYHYPPDTSSYFAGAIYFVSMVASALIGIAIDFVGYRGILAVTCAVLTIPVFGLLAFTYVHPLVCTIWLGVMYSIAAASLWPSIPLVVSQATLGTAMGLTTSVQMIGIGICNLVIGALLDKHGDEPIPLYRWKYMIIFLFANTLACVATSVLLNIVDRRSGGVLNFSKMRSARELPLKDPDDLQDTHDEEEGEYGETDRLLAPGARSVN
ncbi:lysosomal dipeptide transporter MFSD1-like [Branchiostoma floridae x Branchiostoma belcheri]